VSVDDYIAELEASQDPDDHTKAGLLRQIKAAADEFGGVVTIEDDA
jgi:hypothetical protein